MYKSDVLQISLYVANNNADENIYTYSVDDSPSSVSQWIVAACINSNYLAT